MKAPELLEAKKRRILTSACRLLVKHGFQNISLDEVARSAGVAKGTLFLHYKNKSDLFSAVFADMVDRLGDELEKVVASGRRGRALLDETARVILTHFDRYHDFVANFSSGAFPACTQRCGEKLTDKFRRNYNQVSKILLICRSDGLFKSGSIPFASTALFGLCRSAMMLRAARKANYPLAGKSAEVVRFFLSGMCGKATGAI